MDGAVRAAESVRSAISATSFAVEDSSFAITMSFGVAEHVDGRTIDATMAVADRALYRAKNAGRDRVVAGQP
jgi:diguanylate cyclase (GGDEF)-like protein